MCGIHGVRQLVFLVLMGGAIAAAAAIVIKDDNVDDAASSSPNGSIAVAAGAIIGITVSVAAFVDFMLPAPRGIQRGAAVAPQNAAGQ